MDHELKSDSDLLLMQIVDWYDNHFMEGNLEPLILKIKEHLVKNESTK